MLQPLGLSLNQEYEGLTFRRPLSNCLSDLLDKTTEMNMLINKVTLESLRRANPGWKDFPLGFSSDVKPIQIPNIPSQCRCSVDSTLVAGACCDNLYQIAKVDSSHVSSDTQDKYYLLSAQNFANEIFMIKHGFIEIYVDLSYSDLLIKTFFDVSYQRQSKGFKWVINLYEMAERYISLGIDPKQCSNMPRISLQITNQIDIDYATLSAFYSGNQDNVIKVAIENNQWVDEDHKILAII